MSYRVILATLALGAACAALQSTAVSPQYPSSVVASARPTPQATMAAPTAPQPADTEAAGHHRRNVIIIVAAAVGAALILFFSLHHRRRQCDNGCMGPPMR